MAAGLGFIEFSTGDVLSAAAANGYLASQTVMVFASAAARTSAITSPQEGMFSFLKDTNATQFYDGAAWTNLDSTGMVNPMTTTGDTIYSSSGTTPARLGIGTAGQVLKVNSGATAPEWGTVSTGALTLISSTTFSGSSAHNVNDVFSTTYQNYLIQVTHDSSSITGYQQMRLRVSGADNTTSNYFWSGLYNISNALTPTGEAGSAQTSFTYGYMETTGNGHFTMNISNPFESKPTSYALTSGRTNGSQSVLYYNAAAFNANTSFTGFTLYPASGTITGKVRVYGYSN